MASMELLESVIMVILSCCTFLYLLTAAQIAVSSAEIHSITSWNNIMHVCSGKTMQWRNYNYYSSHYFT